MQILRLANDDQTETIDLLGGPFFIRSGFDFSTPGQGGTFTYEPFGAQFDFGNFQPQTEVFDLAIRGTGAEVIAALDRLQDFLESIRLFHSKGLSQQSSWLEWSASRESAKRSVLYSGTFKAISQDNITPGLEDCMILGTLSLTRHPLWEDIAYKTVSTIPGSHIHVLGGTLAITSTTGNTLARIWRMIIDELSGDVGNEATTFWIGIRREEMGTTNFNPLWDLDDAGTFGTDTAIVGADVVCDFATDPTLVNRIIISVANVAVAYGHTDYNHFVGRYLVLMRCYVDAGTAGIQMHSGYTGQMVHEEVYVDSTDAHLYPLGIVQIPVWNGADYTGAVFTAPWRIDIYAEELVACDLTMTHLILVPADNQVYLDGTHIEENEFLSAYTDTDEVDRVIAYSRSTTQISDAVDVADTEWYLPPGNSILVMAGDNATAQSASQTVHITLNYHPRWSLYRGA